jgi:hypothetical protein
MKTLPTWWYRTEYYWIGEYFSFTKSNKHILMLATRLPALGFATPTEASLSHAPVILAAATYNLGTKD